MSVRSALMVSLGTNIPRDPAPAVAKLPVFKQARLPPIDAAQDHIARAYRAHIARSERAHIARSHVRSLSAGGDAQERLARSCARPPRSLRRLSLGQDGQILDRVKHSAPGAPRLFPRARVPKLNHLGAKAVSDR